MLIEWVMLVRNRNFDSKVGPSPCTLWLVQGLTKGLATSMGRAKFERTNMVYGEIYLNHCAITMAESISIQRLSSRCHTALRDGRYH
jgi:hypothetical protein